MCHDRLRNRSALLRIIMASILAGAIALRLLPRVPGVSPDLADGLAGLFHGLAIGMFLVLARRSRGAAT